MEKIKILIVDDSFVTRLRVKNILKELGDFNIFEAKDGSEALTKINEETYHLLLLDLLMPNIDGFEVLKELRNKKKALPTIVLSADIQNTTKGKCMALGALHIAPKTADLAELKELVKQTLKLQ